MPKLRADAALTVPGSWPSSPAVTVPGFGWDFACGFCGIGLPSPVGSAGSSRSSSSSRPAAAPIEDVSLCEHSLWCSSSLEPRALRDSGDFSASARGNPRAGRRPRGSVAGAGDEVASDRLSGLTSRALRSRGGWLLFGTSFSSVTCVSPTGCTVHDNLFYREEKTASGDPVSRDTLDLFFYLAQMVSRSRAPTKSRRTTAVEVADDAAVSKALSPASRRDGFRCDRNSDFAKASGILVDNDRHRITPCSASPLLEPLRAPDTS